MTQTAQHTPAKPHVEAIHISPGGIPKLPQPAIDITAAGLVGDGHNHEKHRTPLQAVCILDREVIDELCEEGYDLIGGSTGENLTCVGLDANNLKVGDRLQFSGGVELEITKLRAPCYVLDAIDPKLKTSMRGKAGCYGKVITEGRMQPGETIEVVRTADF